MSCEIMSPYEKKVFSVFGPMGDRVFRRRLKKNSPKLHTVRELVQSAGIEESSLSEAFRGILDRPVSGLCRVNSRFTKECLCAPFEDDTEEHLIWAMEHGAVGLICKKQIRDYPCLVTDNPPLVFAKMCRLYRASSPAPATAIVGSIGKTTTKRMVRGVLAAQYKTFCDPENENQVDCAGYCSQHIYKNSSRYVQEVSEDQPGGVAAISEMIYPEIAVVTAIDKSHIAHFGSEEAIRDEIASITYGMPEDGKVIISLDDPSHADLIKDRKTVSVSLQNPEADYFAKDISLTPSGLTFTIVDRERNLTFPVKLHYVFAQHNIICALQAFAAGRLGGVSDKNIIKGLRRYRAAGFRQNVFRAGKNLLYVDCYNSIAKSVKSAVKAASEIPVREGARRIAVIGDIEELGEFSEAVHEELMQIVDQSKIDILFAFGPKISKAAREVSVRGSLKIACFEEMGELNRALKKEKKRGDLILFKASRKSELEHSVRAVFPLPYYAKMVANYYPALRWRIRVIHS